LAGTDRGLFVLDKIHNNWHLAAKFGLAQSIPSVPIVELKLEPTTDSGDARIMALTHGRGAWLSNAIRYMEIPNN
jgi:hypothetical protein